MACENLYPPLTEVEKTLVDTFCAARPCQLHRVLREEAVADGAGDREAFYTACRTICTCVHFCPLGGGRRYMEAADGK